MPQFLQSITSPIMKGRLEDICRERAGVQVVRYMLGEENFIRWVHSVGVATDQQLRSMTPAIPPEDLRRMVADPREELFLWTGLIDVENILNLHAQYDRLGPGRALDFGAGCGRLSRFISMSGDFEVCACDTNPKLVQWCGKNLPKVRTSQNGYLPPTSYQDNVFGLIYSLSVFTHLTEEASDLWRKELCRILSPGGLLIVTSHGFPAISIIACSPEHQKMFGMNPAQAASLASQLEQSDFLFFGYDQSVLKVACAGPAYGNSFVHPRHIAARWHRDGLSVLAHLSGGLRGWQDIVVLRKDQ